MQMANLAILVAALSIVGIAAILVRRGFFWSAGLAFAGWLASAIWAWRSSTDTRHPDYSLAGVGGDPLLIFAVNTLLFGLPLYMLGAVIGLAIRFWRADTPSQPPNSENNL